MTPRSSDVQHEQAPAAERPDQASASAGAGVTAAPDHPAPAAGPPAGSPPFDAGRGTPGGAEARGRPEGTAPAGRPEGTAPVGRPEDMAEAADGAGADAPTVEDLITELESVISQRDEYLALARARQAEFENYRKQMMRRQADHLQQAAAGLVEKLLPVLDAFDYGLSHGEDNLAPLRAQMLDVLGKEGLERVAPEGQPFDPTLHDAVAHEAGEGGPEVVTEVLRPGYRWNGRLLRPAMVKVRS